MYFTLLDTDSCISARNGASLRQVAFQSIIHEFEQLQLYGNVVGDDREPALSIRSALAAHGLLHQQTCTYRMKMCALISHTACMLLAMA